MSKRSFIYLSLLASVAACSSGGGGTNSAGVAAATVTNPPRGNIAAFDGTNGGVSTDSQEVAFSYNCPGDPCGAGAPTSTAGNVSKVTLTNDGNGNVTAMALNISEGGATIQHSFDLTTAQGAAQDGFFQVADGPVAGGDPNQYTSIFAGSADPNHSLSYVTFGYWAQSNPADGAAPGSYGAFVAGNATPAANMLRTGTYSYNGSAVGQLTANGANPGFDILSGTMQASVNFDQRTVGGTMALNATGDNIVAPNNTGFWNNVSFAGSVAANSSHFTGTVNAPATTVGPNSVVQTEAMTGNMAGGFYGPQADNLGATFSMAGAGAGGSSALGAMGGKR
jgi:hypothetical protein